MEKAKESMRMLAEGRPFQAKYRVHELQGSMKGVWDMHIAHNWLLLFRYRDAKVIELLRTGTHASINVSE